MKKKCDSHSFQQNTPTNCRKITIKLFAAHLINKKKTKLLLAERRQNRLQLKKNVILPFDESSYPMCFTVSLTTF